MKLELEDLRWKKLLLDWQTSLREIHDSRAHIWTKLALPSIDELTLRTPDLDQLANLEKTLDDSIDPELLTFFRITDGWPLWLGSYQVGIAPASRIGLFRDLFPDTYAIASEDAPSRRDHSDGNTTLSKSDLRSAIVISDLDAREFVFTLPSYETCLFYFSGMNVFKNFFEFMEFQKAQTHAMICRIMELGKD